MIWRGRGSPDCLLHGRGFLGCIGCIVLESVHSAVPNSIISVRTYVGWCGEVRTVYRGRVPCRAVQSACLLYGIVVWHRLTCVQGRRIK